MIDIFSLGVGLGIMLILLGVVELMRRERERSRNSLEGNKEWNNPYEDEEDEDLYDLYEVDQDPAVWSLSGSIFHPEMMAGDPRSPQEVAYVEQFTTESELLRYKRRSDEYFMVIESIEKQRNDWIVMWREQASSHQSAQFLLEGELAKTRQVAARAIMMLNALRKQHDLPPVIGADGLVPYDREPIGIAKDYAEKMVELRAAIAAPIDGLVERDEIYRSTLEDPSIDVVPASLDVDDLG